MYISEAYKGLSFIVASTFGILFLSFLTILLQKIKLFSINQIKVRAINLLLIFFFFSFRPFPSIKGSYSVLSSNKPSCFQRPSPSHQPLPYLPSPHLKIFSLVSPFSSFPETLFPSSFFLHILGLSS